MLAFLQSLGSSPDIHDFSNIQRVVLKGHQPVLSTHVCSLPGLIPDVILTHWWQFFSSLNTFTKQRALRGLAENSSCIYVSELPVPFSNTPSIYFFCLLLLMQQLQLFPLPLIIPQKCQLQVLLNATLATQGLAETVLQYTFSKTVPWPCNEGHAFTTAGAAYLIPCIYHCVLNTQLDAAFQQLLHFQLVLNAQAFFSVYKRCITFTQNLCFRGDKTI